MVSNLRARNQALAGAASWEVFSNSAKDWITIDPPARHATVLYYATGYIHLPVLAGLARQPYFRPDGTLVAAPGYPLKLAVEVVAGAGFGTNFNTPLKFMITNVKGFAPNCKAA